MINKFRFTKRAHISRRKFDTIFDCFVVDISAIKATKEGPMPAIRRVVKSGSDIYTDSWRSYNTLAVYVYNHKKVKYIGNGFAREDRTHINGVESFWSWAKQRLSKYNGMTKEQFSRYLIEFEWRYNHRGKL